MREGRIGHGSVGDHLRKLKEAGLVNYETVSPIGPYTFYSLTDAGKTIAKWPVFIRSDGAKSTKLSDIVHLAIIGLALEKKESFSSSAVKSR